MSKLFHINEDDLATMEQFVPALMWMNLESCNSTAQRMKWRKLQEILSNVRWNGGPPAEVESFPADGPLPTAD